MISYASVPGRGIVIALCVLFVVVTVMVVRAGRRRRERAGAIADAVEPPATRTVKPPAARTVEPPATRTVKPPAARTVEPPAVLPPVTRSVLPPAEAFPAPARWPRMNNSRFGRHAVGAGHVAAAPSARR